MSRIIDADALRAKMYHEAFETDSEMQKWDSGCWIRYKLFENCIDEQHTLSPDDVRVKATLFGGDADGYADGFPVYSSFVCSACGEEFGVDDGQPPPFNYCPECGAKFNLVQGAGYTEKKSLNKEAN